MAFFSYRTLLGCLLTVTVSVCWALGAQGHRIAGSMAQSLLTTKARMAVLALLPEGLAVESTYLDRQRPLLNREYPGSASWHFINLPVCGEKITRDRVMHFCLAGQCLPVQYNKVLATLQTATATTDEKRFALRVLIHLLEDAVQPLHAAGHDDLGGNRVRIMHLARYNLHSAYDTYFIKRNIRGFSESAYVKYLIEHYRPQEAQMIQGDIIDWILESYHYATTFVYPQLPGFACGQPLTQTHFSEEYTKHAQDIVARQLAAAGFRLAHVLNTVFDASYVFGDRARKGSA